MKNITFPLSPKERASLYYELGKLGAFCGGEPLVRHFENLTANQLLSIACEESRFDPRLLGILIDYFSKHYRQINPFGLAKAIQKIATPQTLGVISEFAKKTHSSSDLKAFFDIVLRDIHPSPIQIYFNTQVRPRVKIITKKILYTPNEFRKWGFFSDIDPYLKEFRPKKAYWTFTSKDRQKILDDLMAQGEKFRMKDYLRALGGSITRQQAFIDLKNRKDLKKIGKNRGRVYQRKRFEKSD